MTHVAHTDHEDAAAWALIAADRAFTDDERVRFEAWIVAAPERAALFDRASRALGEGALRAAASDLAAPAASGWREALAGVFERRWVPALGGLATACLALVVALALRPAVEPVIEPVRVASAEGGTQVALLGGGSARLNAGTALQVVESATESRVTLERGQAFFETGDVAPLVVLAGDVSVRPLGTAFDVDAIAGGVLVEVHRGAVALADAAGPIAELAAGERAFHRAGRLTQLTGFDPQAREDWRTGWLEVDAEPLEIVLARLERETDAAIRVRGAALRSAPVSGRFRTGEPEATLEALSALYGFKVTREGETLIVARP